MRLSLATRLVGADWDELTDALRDLAGDTTEVVELEPFPDDRTPSRRRGPPAGDRARRAPAYRADAAARPYSPEPPAADRRRRPSRDAAPHRRGQRAQAPPGRADAGRRASPRRAELQRRPRRRRGWSRSSRSAPVADPEPTRRDRRPRVEPRRRPGDRPASWPRPAAGSGSRVDQLAERTRIRPHVIESIEVDDFAPCGGDFYARGHLRTLARVLGVDAAPLLRVVRRALRRRPDRRAPGLRGRAGHRRRRRRSAAPAAA